MSITIVNIDDAEPTYLEGTGGAMLGLAAGVLPRIEQWLETLRQRSLDRHADYPDLANSYSMDPLRKFIRIVMAYDNSPTGSRSVHAFVDPFNGDVFKSHSWAKPAKIVRFNLLDDESFARMIETCDEYGSYLYVR